MIKNLKRIRSIDFTISISISISSPFKPYSFSSSSSSSAAGGGGGGGGGGAALPLNAQRNPTKSDLKTLILKQYSHGKFSNLITNVVSLPSVLLTACQNLANAASTSLYSPTGSTSPHSLLHSATNREEMGREIREQRFDIDSCCVELKPPERGEKEEVLVLPNLRLKVLIEAIRMVLEVVYDERFATFSYGGRVGMGRHTAIRYLENSVENPSWWFNVSFYPQKFSKSNVDKLCSFIQEKINDEMLIHIVRKLFECGVLRIEIGGCYLGRGLPQESGLCSILINIYFDAFDKEIQEMRLNMKQNNPEIESADINSSSTAFFTPVKMYAVRYLDEILVITSGSKMLTMGLKDHVVEILETKSGLKVDKYGVKTAIHSAVSEKMVFLGMELQAVPPSVLHPPLSEKAVRAKKKYLRQKEVQALELKNAKERNRKMLGKKIFRHVFNKTKKHKDMETEHQVEQEVRDVFRDWANEVVQEFTESLEQRSTWHRLLTNGDFLSLKHIRAQLPNDLVHAYDEFQTQVNNHLSPVKARKAMEEEERRVREEEERRYAERTLADLTKLSMKVDAPIQLVRKAVRLVGFTNHMGRPRPISSLLGLEDADIIKWYAGIGKRWLDFFCCCRNFKNVKIVVSYHLRFSCILTLAEKHESTKRETIKHFTKDLKVCDVNGVEEVCFPTERGVKMMGDKNLCDPKPVDGLLSSVFVRLVASDELPYRCAAHFCDRMDTIVYRLWLLQERLNVDPMDLEKWVMGVGVVHGSLNRKCFAFCSDHISDLYMGKITLQEIDCTAFVDDV